jgi:pimeloyl-ACP methyl ester carboxylesterase
MVTLVAVACLIAAGALYQFVGSRLDARKYPAPGQLIDAGGERLHVVCAGRGRPTVFFESGIAASSLSWTRVFGEVSSFTGACAYDRAGLGWSAPARSRRSLGRMMSELHEVVARQSSAGPVVLVGHSFGAFLVCAYASRHPEAVAGIVLLDPPSDWHAVAPRQARLLRGAIQLSRLGALLARVGIVRACLALLTGGAPGVPRNFVRVFGPTAARTLERLVGEVRKLPPEVYPVVQALWCEPKCFRSMACHLAALEETAAFVGGITSLPGVPLIVISSGDRSAETIESHRQLTRLSPQSRHIVATGSGHWIQFDARDLVVGAVRDVVEQARRTHAA